MILLQATSDDIYFLRQEKGYDLELHTNLLRVKIIHIRPKLLLFLFHQELNPTYSTLYVVRRMCFTSCTVYFNYMYLFLQKLLFYIKKLAKLLTGIILFFLLLRVPALFINIITKEIIKLIVVACQRFMKTRSWLVASPGLVSRATKGKAIFLLITIKLYGVEHAILSNSIVKGSGEGGRGEGGRGGSTNCLCGQERQVGGREGDIKSR